MVWSAVSSTCFGHEHQHVALGTVLAEDAKDQANPGVTPRNDNSELAQIAKERLGSDRVQFVGDSNALIERVAIVCGAGGEFLSDARSAGADVLLTGEMRFHDYLSAQAQGLALILPGHYATERFGIEELAQRLQKQFADLQVWASKRECDPVQSI